MRRALKWAARVVAALIMVPLVLVGLGLGWLGTPSGHRYVAGLVGRVTSGQVAAHGLSGNLFVAPRFASVELRDPDGPWAVVHDLEIDWSLRALLRRDVKITRLAADRIEVRRRPVPTAGGGKTTSWYGFRVDIDAVRVQRIDLAPPVAGLAAALAAEGNVHLASPSAGDAVLAVSRLDAPGAYEGKFGFSPDRIAADLSAREPPKGLIANAAHLPDLGALAVSGSLAGPLSAVAARLSVAAGELRAGASGNLDLEHGAVDLDVTADAPAMTPRPDLSWQSVALDAHVHGAYASPNASGTLRIAELAAVGASVRLLAADISGNSGHLALNARAENVRIPGPKPDMLAGSPLALAADLRLDAPGRPLTFTLSHKLIAAKGSAETLAPMHGQATLDLPDLAPLAAAAQVDVRGRSALGLDFTAAGESQRVDVAGTLAITGGLPQAIALIGESGRIALRASVADDTIDVSAFDLRGRAVEMSGHGRLASGSLDLAWKAALPDLHAALPTLSGRIEAAGELKGPPTDLAVNARASGDVGAEGVPRGPVRLAVALSGLPNAPAGRVTAEGELDRAPLALAAGVTRAPDGTIRVAIDRADWKSAHGEGALTLPPGATIPQGRLALRMNRLADVQLFIGMPVAGSLGATAEFAHDRAQVRAELHGVRLPGATEIANAVLTATVADPVTRPAVDASLVAEGVRTAAASGNGRIDVRGPEERLAFQLGAKLDQLAGARADIASAGVVNAKAKDLTLASLQATWRGAALRLLAPARIAFGTETAVEHLRLGMAQAVLDVNGRVEPTLDLQLALANVTPDLARVVVPTLPRASGTLGGTARLSGTLARPVGTARVSATGLRMLSGPGQVLPPANFSATANLDGSSAQVDARLAAGSATQLAVTGTAGLESAGPLNLRAAGSLDLAMVNPLTEAQGTRVRGRLALNASVTGTLAAPALGGTAQLAGGEVQDFVHGADLTDIQATLEGAGGTVRLAALTARAGQGTISGSGSVGLLAPGIPVALRVTMNDAKPLASNLLTATIDADVSVAGDALHQLGVSGTVQIRRADISVPENMPRSVAVLPVRVAGQPPPPPPTPGPNIALDLNLTATREIFVRGRGLSAEFGGTLHLGGTAKRPQPNGAFRMIRGQYNLAGTTLDFTEGEITFAGRGNIGPGAERIDPALHFVATTSSANVTATLTVSGYASDPKITLSSVPQLPQDEILAQLLFGRSIKNLSPFQVAQIGSTLAELGGLTSGGIGDPLNRLRGALALDRLTIGTNPVNPAVTPGTQENNTNTVVQAGRYVAPGVYVGAVQSVSGPSQQTGATVQIDLTKHLKLQTGVGSGLGANNIGLTYQFQY